MPLNYASVESFASKFVEQSLQRQAETNKIAAELTTAFEQAASVPDQLRQSIEQAEISEAKLYTAKPMHESLLSSYPLPQQPDQFTLLAADGSQIVPSRHRALQFGLINVGLFKVSFGSGLPPVIDLISELLDVDQLFTSDGTLIGDDEVALQRDLRERILIRDNITSEDTRPILTVTDGPLDLFYRSSIQAVTNRDAQSDVYQLDQRFEQEGVISAGYIDKPGAAMLDKMLEIYQKAQFPSEQTVDREKRRISDRALLSRRLLPGHRSALFEIISKRTPVNPQRLHCAFFYLNVAADAGTEWLARVEIPYWVAQKPQLVNFVHAVLYRDAQVLDSHPYPYSLHRAHELALVRQAEHEEIEHMLLSKLPQNAAGISPRSNKDHWKGQK